MKFIFLLLLFPSSLLASQTVAFNQSLSLETGIYSINTDYASASGIGLFGLEYARHLTPKWSLLVNYSQLFDRPTNISGAVNGFDLMVNRCLSQCLALKQTNSGLEIISYPEWSWSFLLGLSNRNLQVGGATVGYNGAKGGIELSWQKESAFSWFSRLTYSMLANGGQEFTMTTLTAGIRWSR